MFVWEADTAREYQNLQGHKGPITDVSWRLDSNVLASASEDGTIKLWEMENGSQVKNWNAHPGGVTLGRVSLTTGGSSRPAAIASPKSGMATAPSKRPSSPWATSPCGRSSRTTTPAWRPATGWAKSGCWRSPTVSWWRRLPLNPPTLAMAVEAENGRFAAATKALEQAAGELTLAQADLDAKSKALGLANDALAAGTAAAQKAAADLAGAQMSLKQKEADERGANDRLAQAKAAAAAGGDQAALDAAVTKAQQELDKIVAEKQALAKTVTDLTTANDVVAKQLATLQANQTAAAVAKPPAEQALAAKSAAHKAATDALAAAQAVPRSGHGRQSRLRRGPSGHAPCPGAIATTVEASPTVA